MDNKPCPSCGGNLKYEIRPGTRDETLGPSLYCDRCLYREWGQRPTRVPEPDKVKDQHQSIDWRLEEYERRAGTPTFNQITPQIVLGDIIDAWILRDQGTGKPFDAILNVSQKTYTPPPDVEYVNIPLSEYGSKPEKQKRREADFEAALEQLEKWVAEGKKVFVHCVAGANRSAALVAASLVDQGMSYIDALNFVREKRPVAWPHGQIFLTLRKHEQEQTSAKQSATESGGDFLPLQPTGSRIAIDKSMRKLPAGSKVPTGTKGWVAPNGAIYLVPSVMGQTVHHDDMAHLLGAKDWEDLLHKGYIRWIRSPHDIMVNYLKPSRALKNFLIENYAPGDSIYLGQESGLDNRYKDLELALDALEGRWAKRAVDEGAQFVARVDWQKPFDVNYLQIEAPDTSIDEYDAGEGMWEPQNPASERFVRADVLITKAMGQEHYQAQQHPQAPPTGQKINVMAKPKQPAPKKTAPKKAPKPKEMGPTRPMFSEEKWRPPIPYKEGPTKAIERNDPKRATEEVLSLRGLVLPAPHVFQNGKYQQAYERAPLIPLDSKDPQSIDRCIEFMKTARPAMVESSGGATGYFRCPSTTGNRRVDHVLYASWFAIFSANTAVESEETQFVLWQAGKSSGLQGSPGLMSNYEKIGYWLQFLKWAGFPTFENLYRVLEGFDQSDESYERRLLALSRLPGMQFKVSSFLLALLGDLRSPTLDMHALAYLIDTGKVKLSSRTAGDWTAMSELQRLADEMAQIMEQNLPTSTVTDDEEADEDTEKSLTTKKLKMNVGKLRNINFQAAQRYAEVLGEYTKAARRNKMLIMNTASQLYVSKEETTEPKQMKVEKRKVKEYIRRQMAGWDGDTDSFWKWYASQPFFTTHEGGGVGLDMVHTVFFQSLFPELFTPEALASRKYEEIEREKDPEKQMGPERRMKYRDIEENLEEMRRIQPRKPELHKKTPIKPAPEPEPPPVEEDFDWETGS